MDERGRAYTWRMEPVYQDWEDAARRADNVQQEVIRITRVGLPAPLELLEQLVSLENDLLAKLNALENARPMGPSLH